MIKERIKQKAEELFHLYGIRSVTMDEISTQLAISKKTLYRFFDDKKELVDEVVKDLLERTEESCAQCREIALDAVHEHFVALEVLDKIMEAINSNMLFDLERGYPVSFGRFRKFRDVFLHQIIVANIRWGKKEGLFRQEIDEEIYAKARLEMVVIPFDERLFPRTQFTLTYTQRELSSLFLYSLITPKGLKYVEKYFVSQRKKMTNPEQ